MLAKHKIHGIEDIFIPYKQKETTDGYNIIGVRECDGVKFFL